MSLYHRSSRGLGIQSSECHRDWATIEHLGIIVRIVFHFVVEVAMDWAASDLLEMLFNCRNLTGTVDKS